MDARYVIAAALSLRNEELSGEAAPMDNDGARLVLRELEAHGFTVNKTDDGAADAVQEMGGSLPLAVPSSLTREQLIDDAARALCLDPHNGSACDMHRVDGALVVDALLAAGHLLVGGGEGSGPERIGGQSGASPFVAHRFKLYRHSDPSGVSGTGVVAEGVEFADGSVALHWPGNHPSTAVWGNIADAVAVHGHGGQTEVRWIDDRPIDLWPADEGSDR